jgi:hypothetical protein
MDDLSISMSPRDVILVTFAHKLLYIELVGWCLVKRSANDYQNTKTA